jgi:hypothetical protein
VERVAHEPDPGEILGRPAGSVRGVDDPVLDEPVTGIGRFHQVVDELAGFELARVEEVERGLEVKLVAVDGGECRGHSGNHLTGIDRLRASGYSWP